MKAYIYDDLPYVATPPELTSRGDQREPHHSGEDVSLEVLGELGVIHREFPIDKAGEWEKNIDVFAKERGYKNRDRITVTKEGLGELYETKIKSFFDEHLHEDEEIRYILAGSGYFDVRGEHAPHNERWIRIQLDAGDLIVLPAGIYHRFTVDSKNTITAMRLFQDEPKWTPYSRSQGDTDGREARKVYLDEIKGSSGVKV